MWTNNMLRVGAMLLGRLSWVPSGTMSLGIIASIVVLLCNKAYGE